LVIEFFISGLYLLLLHTISIMFMIVIGG